MMLKTLTRAPSGLARPSLPRLKAKNANGKLGEEEAAGIGCWGAQAQDSSPSQSASRSTANAASRAARRRRVGLEMLQRIRYVHVCTVHTSCFDTPPPPRVAYQLAPAGAPSSNPVAFPTWTDMDPTDRQT